MKATFIKTEGPWLEAELQIGDHRLKAMDELSIDERFSPKPGEEIEIELSALVNEDEEWDEIFRANPKKKKGLEHIEDWRYRAFGKVISINPVTVDCELLNIIDVIHSSDPSIVGEFIGFTIDRLEANHA